MSIGVSVFYNNKKVFITGHTGFKGSWLCETLLSMGAEVYGYALEPPTEPSLFHLLGLSERMDSAIGDIRDYNRLFDAVDTVRPDIVIHMAAQPIVRESYKFPRETYETNVMGTVNLLEAVKQVDCVKSFVNVTTDKVYKNDERKVGYIEDTRLDGYDPYSNSKSCSELVTGCYKRSFFNGMNIAVSTVRAGNVIGGGDFAKDRLIPDAYRALVSGESLIIRNPDYIRPFWHVLDACYAYLLLAMKQYEDKSYAGCYNVGPDEKEIWSVGSLVSSFSEKIKPVVGRSLQFTFSTQSGPHEDVSLQLNSSKFAKNFSWKPRWDTTAAVTQTAKWYGCFLNQRDVVQLTKKQIALFMSQTVKY